MQNAGKNIFVKFSFRRLLCGELQASGSAFQERGWMNKGKGSILTTYQYLVKVLTSAAVASVVVPSTLSLNKFKSINVVALSLSPKPEHFVACCTAKYLSRAHHLI